MSDGFCNNCGSDWGRTEKKLRTRIATLENDCRIMAGEVPLGSGCYNCVNESESEMSDTCFDCQMVNGSNDNYKPSEAVAIAKKWGKG